MMTRRPLPEQHSIQGVNAASPAAALPLEQPTLPSGLPSGLLSHAALDALDAHVCILNADGTIIATNAAWKRFAENNAGDAARTGLGSNYLETCDIAQGGNADEAAAVAAGIRAVISGRANRFELEYPCHAPTEQRWFVIRVTRLQQAGETPHVVITHENITERHREQEELREREQRLRMMIEMMSDYMYSTTIEPDGGIVSEWVAGPLERICGYTHEELQTLPGGWTALLHPDDLPAMMQRAQQLRTSTAPIVAEYRIQHKDGSLRWLRDHMRVVDDAGDGKRRVIGATKDITAQKLAELSLLENELRLLRAEHIGQLGSFEWNLTSGKLSVSPGLERLFGITGNGDPRQVLELLHPDDRAEVLAYMDQVLSGGFSPSILQFRLVTGDDEIRYMQTICEHVRDTTNKTVEIIGVVQDITAQIQADLQMQSIIRTSIDGFMLVQRNKGVIDANPALCDLLGYTRAELLQLGTWDVVTAVTRAEVNEHIRRILQYGQARFEVQVRRKDGVMLDVEVSATYHPPSGRFFAFMRDITARKAAESALKESELRFRLLVEGSPDAIFLSDAETGMITDVNQTAVNLIGRPHAELTGMYFWELHPPQLAAYVKENFAAHRQQTRQGATGRPTEAAVLRADGSEIPVEVVAQQLVLRGRPVLYGIFRDISERKVADAALKQRNRQLSLLNNIIMLVNSSLNLHYVLDMTCRELAHLFNVPQIFAGLIDREQQLLRISAEYLEGGQSSSLGIVIPIVDNPTLDFIARNQEPLIFDAVRHDTRFDPLRDLIADREAAALLLVPLLVERQLVGVIMVKSLQPHSFSDEEISLAVLSAHALSGAMQNSLLHQRVVEQNEQLEERVAERTGQLRQSEARYRAVVESQHEPVCRFRADNREVLFANRAFVNFAGKPVEDVLGGDMLSCFPAGLRGKIEQHIALLIRTGEGVTVEYQLDEAQGLWLECTYQPVLNETGSVVEVQFVGYDITTLKQAETTLQHSLEKEKQVSEMRSRFISIASHEFRNPLAAIQMSVSILENYLDRLDAEKRARHFVRIHSQIARMNDLLGDVLLIGRAESGRLTFKPNLLDVESFVGGVVENFRALAASTNNGIVLTYSNGCSIRQIEADDNLLTYILNNLISNAIKYMPYGGEVQVRLTCAQDCLRIAVQDEGIGIPAADQGRLFNAFQRAANVGTIEGTGLGLLITKQAVELHGGEISFTSVEGEGTTFVVTLPLTQAGRK